jgi:integrase/recombinase XerD
MVRALFPRSCETYERSPFGRELADFCDWLGCVGYSKANIRGHLRRLFRVLSHARGVGADVPRSTAFLHHAFGRYCTCVRLSQDYRGTERAYERYLTSKRRLLEEQSPDDPLALLRDRYQQYLVEVRGFARPTVEQHTSTVLEFLQGALRGRRDITTLTSEHIEQYLSEKSTRISRQSLQHVVAHLRAFCRFGFSNGLVRNGLDVIDSPRAYRDELPPRALPWDLVQKLLRSVDLKSKAGWRDYMILHFMAYYGLRASEIAALRVEDINWRSKTCRIEQRKTQSDLLLPLSDRTLALLKRYLRHRRPDRPLLQLFIRVRRPTGGLHHYAVCDIFSKRAAQSGLPLDAYSSYCLRHSFAMRLLQRGIGVKAIGDLLGHRSLEATCVYLRLDASTLRSVALPLPGLRAS